MMSCPRKQLTRSPAPGGIFEIVTSFSLETNSHLPDNLLSSMREEKSSSMGQNRPRKRGKLNGPSRAKKKKICILEVAIFRGGWSVVHNE